MVNSRNLWSWSNCKSKIESLRNRLGFTDRIEFLGFNVSLEHGRVYDEVRKKYIKDCSRFYWILYYYAEAKEVPLKNELIKFESLPGGAQYVGVFHREAVAPLVEKFGSNLELLEKAAEYFRASKMNWGDLSFQIRALPLIPITFVFWMGTEEFPPHLSLFFDASAGNYLPTEAIASLSALVARRLSDAAENLIPRDLI